MKYFKKRAVMSIFLFFLVLPMYSLWMNVTLAGAEEISSSQDREEPSYSSHSSPYYFHVNSSSPLLNDDEDSQIEQDISNPKSSQYWYSEQDYALTLYLDKYAITPGESIGINLRLTDSFNPSPDGLITVEIYKGFYRHYYYYYPGFYDSVLVYSHQFITDEEGEISFSFSDTSTSGSYTIFAYYDNDYVATYREFSVSETGVFLKGSKYYMENQEYHAAVHIVNISDFSSASSHNYTYTISAYDSDEETWINLQTNERQTDTFGYDVFHSDPIVIGDQIATYFWNSLRLTIESEDGTTYSTFLYQDWRHYYYTLWGGEQQANYDMYQFVVSSDKTIYSPGETIKLRVLVFQYTYLNETRLPYGNQQVQLTILNPSELAIFWTTIQTNTEGVAIIELPLDYDCETGIYGFEFHIGEIEYRHSIRVDYYEKPVFRVTINTDGKEFYPKTRGLARLYQKEIYEGSVDVEYYFGQPVVDAEVVLSILNYYDIPIYEISGKTNGLGRFKFSIDLKWLSGIDWSFKVQAVVTDIYDRTAEVEKKYTRMEDLLVYGYVADWAPLPDEPTVYYFNVFQVLISDHLYGYEYNPLANVTVKIEIYGVKEYPIYITTIRARTRLNTIAATTNEYGAGKIEFLLPIEDVTTFNLFEVRLNVELEDGRETSWSTYYRYRKYRLDITIQNTNLTPGDTLQFTATYMDVLAQVAKEGEGRIYIYDSTYNLLGRSNFEIEGSRSFQMKIPSFAPEGTYYIYSYVYSRSNEYYGGFLYHSVYKEFSVGTIKEISFITNASNSNAYGIEVNLGDTLQIQGTTNVSTHQPHYFEIYKRGLLYSEHLLVDSNSFSKSLEITSDLGPDFTIMIYTLSDIGQLHEKYMVVHVNFNSGFEVQTDKEVYEPGDSVTLTITPPDNAPMLLSTTFIDSAVLAIEPEDDSELGYFERSSYSAYIGSGSSWGTGVYWENYAWISYEVPRGGFYYPLYWEINGPGGYFTDEMGMEGVGKTIDLDAIINAYDVNVRKNISESANWIPSTVIVGPTNFTFQLPDNIGEWTVRIVGNAIDEKNILWGDVQAVKIKAYLPFFVEFEPPAYSTQDEIISLKAYIYNYVGQNLATEVMIEAPGFDILNNPTQIIYVPNNFVSEVEFSLHARDPLLQNITILAIGTALEQIHSDAKQIKTYIHPNGYENTSRFADFLNQSMGSYLFNYTIDPGFIYHDETLTFYKDLIDISIEGWERLIGYPYGCTEQTSSKLISTALIYRYLNQTGQLTEELDRELTPMIMQGLSRIYNMQNLDGGWGWWSDYASNIQMTTLVILTLQQVELSGFELNSFVVFKAYNFIVNSQESDGSWIYPYYTANSFEASAYTLQTLIKSTNKTSTIENAIQSSLNFLSEDWEEINHQSPYGAALYLISTMGTPYENSTFKSTLLSYLLAERKSSGTTIFWENDEGYYWSNLGNRVEITAYATLALAMDDYLGNYAIIQKAVRFLLDSKSQWGWWSTADSSAAILSLSEIKQLSSSSPLLDFQGIVDVIINSAEIPQISLNLTENLYTPSALLMDLSQFFVEGTNEVNITLIGTGQLAFVFEHILLIRYLPEITIPEIIDVNADHFFNITLTIDPVYSNLELSSVSFSLLNIPDENKVTGEVYTKFIPSITEELHLNFTLITPSNPGEYLLDGIFGFMIIVYNNDSVRGTDHHMMLGPIRIRVDEHIEPIHALFNPDPNFACLNIVPHVAQSINGALSLEKRLSRKTNLLPGDLIIVTLEISNTNEDLQYYALDDYVPTGMVLAEGSIRINGHTITSNNWNVTYEASSYELHFFIPLLESGSMTFQYRLMVNSVKDTVIPSAQLWGMYENNVITSDPIIVSNIPLLYYANQSIYQDLIRPTISEANLVQIEGIDEVQLLLDIKASDNKNINKIRIVFQQGSIWRSQSVYYSDDLEEFSILVTDLDNKDSKIHYFVEVQDEYGNIVSTGIQNIIVHSTIIPYITIGISIGLALAAASVVALIYKKKARDLPTLEGNSFIIESGSE